MVDPKNIPMERFCECVEIDFLQINIQKEREGKFIYILIVVQIEIVHSTPSNSGGKKSASGRRLVIIPALPRIR